MAAVMQILHGFVTGNDPRLTFYLGEGFKFGYRNSIKKTIKEYMSHPRFMWWNGGEILPVEVDLQLAVGVDPVDTPEKLQWAVEQLTNMAIIEKDHHMLDLVSLHIFNGVANPGPWFSFTGVMEQFNVKWNPPFDLTSGRFMTAVVNFTLIPHFSEYGGSQGGTLEGDLPYCPNFRFNDFIGRRRGAGSWIATGESQKEKAQGLGISPMRAPELYRQLGAAAVKDIGALLGVAPTAENNAMIGHALSGGLTAVFQAGQAVGRLLF